MKQHANPLLHWLGIDLIHVSHGERWLSAIGAVLGIAICWGISIQFLGAMSATLIVASMGAGAVLLFAAPHAPLPSPGPPPADTCCPPSSV